MQKRSCAKTSLCKNEVYTKTSFWYATQRNAMHSTVPKQSFGSTSFLFVKTLFGLEQSCCLHCMRCQ
ncbi:hypothetical protein EON70_00460 [bacterium]|nr:MAG: hypothetical protein EON70_00460 [bacterium]